MPVRLRSARATAALAVGLMLVAAGCGGGGSSDGSAPSSSKDGATTTVDIGSIPDFKPQKQEFTEVDGSQARFLNLLPVDGEGIDMDVYWGRDAETGKKAATVKYGEASDWMTMEVAEDPLVENSDGSQDVDVAFYKAGETDREGLIQQKSEPLDGDMSLTYVMGWTKSFGSTTQIPSSLGVSYEHTAGDPPDGKAWVAFNSIGIGGIDGGDFMTLNGSTGCQDLTSQDDIDTANNGQAFLVDPGTTEFTASDANTDCSTKTDPVSIDLAAGDRYVIYAYGTTKEDRQLFALKLGE